MPFTNGDFETGDLTGWTPDYGDDGVAAAVTSGSKRTGTYGCNLTVTGADNGSGASNMDTVISTSFNTISFWYKIAAHTSGKNAILSCVLDVEYIDGEDHILTDLEVYSHIVTSTTDWTNVTITKAEAEALFPNGTYHWPESGNLIVRIFWQAWT